MTEKYVMVNGGIKDTTNDITFTDFVDMLILVNGQSRKITELADENEQLKSLNQELINELNFDAKQYKVFIDIIEEADDLICSHLSQHYQRQWRNFCKNMEYDFE